LRLRPHGIFKAGIAFTHVRTSLFRDMATGLAALLDDIAAIAKLAAASLDDVSAAAGKAGSKAIGVVVDDAAVTPGYAMGFTPQRELPIVWKIARGSLRNKFLYLLPGALLLSAFAPWAVTPILMLGGAYLCFEATEKIIEAIAKTAAKVDAAPKIAELALSSAELEKQKVSGAIRTDLILSGEIMAIALATVADRPFAIQAAALVVVSLGITIAVYGVVGLIVKMDDIGLHLAERRASFASSFGRGMVKSMPHLLKGLAFIGTAAMLWVGGGIIVHGLEHFGWNTVPHFIHELSAGMEAIPNFGSLAAWLIFATGSAVVGFVLGSAIAAAVHFIPKRKR
jgi:predicted DNA repair protein MutK